MSDIIKEANILKSEIEERLIPVNALLKKARDLKISFSIQEGYSSKLESPTVSIYMSIPIQ